MGKTIMDGLEIVLANWNRMQSSEMDEAGDDAEQFEASFYRWIDQLRTWYHSLAHKPADVDEALAIPEIAAITERLPTTLYLNFETELELIIEGQERDDDARYD
ncbi:hypothetical protein ACTID9_06465 [Brevibacillus fluminis]|uniref:hypothetical protein n=1 Tax=Brevibacillus fluminis TaxID=511487 RepID=UPI003F8C075D